MKAAIHYIVKGKFIRCTTADHIDFVKFEEIFEDANPILARERAFEYFENYLDVLFDSDENIRNRFKPQYTNLKELPLPELPAISVPPTIEELKAQLKYFNENYNSKSYYRDYIDIYNGIGIFLVMNAPIVHSGMEMDKYEPEDYPIFGLDFNQDVFDPEVMIDGLTSEFQYYDHFKYDTKDYAIQIKYHYSGKPEPEEEIVLKTPFDWDELFVQASLTDHSSGRDLLQGDPVISVEQNLQSAKTSTFQLLSFSVESIKELLSNGEGKQIEYKSTLLFNSATNKGGISKKGVVAKTICSFLNSLGGFLFIGINDRGIPIGLSSDFSLSGKVDPKDYFKLEFDEMIFHFFSREVHDCIHGVFVEIDNKSVFMVSIYPSKYPVFIKGQDGKLFYIRGTASSQLLTDTEEIIKYCFAHQHFIKL